MPRWKTSEQILNLPKDGEFFDENWMNYNSIFQYIPPSPPGFLIEILDLKMLIYGKLFQKCLVPLAFILPGAHMKNIIL